MSKQPPATKQVFAFEKGDGKNKKLLGGKGANLCEMTQIGLRVPPGFVISTEACRCYLAEPERKLPPGLMDEVQEHMRALEKKTGKSFGDAKNPLLVSVRSGSAVSMPGMMDTILNLGLNAGNLRGLAERTEDERFANDAYRRFIQLFGKVALGVPDELFDEEFEAIKERVGAKEDVALASEDLEEASKRFLDVVRRHTEKPFPENPLTQLEIAIKAVFDSWMGKRAVDYRKQFHVTPDVADGTAVNVVAMVFGNRGNDSATGVAFTRNPGTGEAQIYGEYLVNAQGEDVVAGIRTPKPIQKLKTEMPELYRQLEELQAKLERHYREVQDFEFTIERGTLYCLQTRNGKMNAQAMVRTSVEMEREGLLDKREALLRIDPEHLEQLLHPRLDPAYGGTPIARGLPASPGAASGQVVFDANRAEILGRSGARVVLVREETKPEDIHGFFAAVGILTSRGGKTSHAAVVARGMGKPCVAGAEAVRIDTGVREASVAEVTIKEGDVVTVDGTTGNVYLGEVPTIEPEFSRELETLLKWADEASRLGVMANADTPETARRAVEYGARGIGLCRTERMFNQADRLPLVLEVILAESPAARRAALERLLPIQRSDFKALFEAMSPRPVTIRLLDPPIHEFLPSEDQLRDELDQLSHLQKSVSGMDILVETVRVLALSRGSGTFGDVLRLADPSLVEEAIARKRTLLKKVRSLHEVNPMLGHRGVRLGLTFPEIYAMQIRAVLEATAECVKAGIEVHPEIMVPQVCTSQELKRVRRHVDAVRESVEAAYGLELDVRFGTMIEVVRACLRADSLAEEAEFFSFGTNDLTQATFSFSREDAENKFLPMYNETGILQDNPFEVLDVKGLGKLMELTVAWGRKTKPELKIGICGEHGGHPASIAFCHRIGLDYVSCSGPRIPIARLAAAHAALREDASDFGAGGDGWNVRRVAASV